MTDRDNVLAARVLLSARRLARELGHAWIGTEHVVLGILELEEGGMREELEGAGVRTAEIRDELRRLAPSVDQPARANLPLARSLQELLDGAVARTVSSRLEDVRLEHLLLAMIDRHAGLGYAILVKREVDLDDLERRLLGRLERTTPGTDSPDASSPR